MYTIIHNKDYNITLLKTKKYTLTAMSVKDHLHVEIKGPKGFRKKGLTSVKSKLKNTFEYKHAILSIYNLFRQDEKINLKLINYAQLFTSYFE